MKIVNPESAPSPDTGQRVGHHATASALPRRQERLQGFFSVSEAAVNFSVLL